MGSDRTPPSHEKATLQIIHGQFVSVASEAHQAIEALRDHEEVEHLIERLRRVKQTAEKGAALVKARLEAL